MGKAQRTKGHSYERNKAIDFREAGWPKAKRHLEYQSCEAELGQDLDNTYPFLVQCKAVKNSPSPNSLLAQIKDQKDQYKLGIVKIDRKGEYAIMKWKDFLEIITMLKKEIL